MFLPEKEIPPKVRPTTPSLYRTWRSQTFAQMIGQEAITCTLKNALCGKKLSHAYLFTGPRGTGKTTAARLLAKTVNCTDAQDGEPCNACQQCCDITAGVSFNVIEIDAASHRGIDDIRELRQELMVPPMTGRYKIALLDEAHMLTSEAFHALLKLLEEPPDYTIFVLATTDVQKILPTVLSRCQRFDFKRIMTRQIVEHLFLVAQAEHVNLEQSAAEVIARTATGSMRDALSLLDQAMAYAGKTVSRSQVQAMLGVADPQAISKLITHITDLESSALLHHLSGLAEAGADLRQVNGQVVEYWRALMLARAGADVATILDLTEDEVKEIAQLAPRFALQELTAYARIFAQNDLMQKNQGTPQLRLELAALECIELRRGQQSMEIVAGPVPTFAQADGFPGDSSREGVPSILPSPALPGIRPALSVAAVESEASGPTTLAGLDQRLSFQQVVASWDKVKSCVRQKSSLLATYLGMCDVLEVEAEEKQAVVVIRAAQSAQYTFLKNEHHARNVEWALSTVFHQRCKVRCVPPG